MLRSRAARRASAPSVLPSKGVRLEPQEVNQDDGHGPQEEDETDEKEPAPPLSPEKAEDGAKDNNQDDDEPVVLGNIVLEEDEAPPEAPSPSRDVGRLPPMAWIVAWKKREVWPHVLASVQTPLLAYRYDQSVDDKLATATRNRRALLETRQRAARAHNDHVAHALLLRRDAAAASRKARSVRAAERLHDAEARRSAYVAAKQRTAVAFMEPTIDSSTPVADESLWEASSRRIAAASAARIALLHEKSARAGSILERAKSIAADVASLHDQYATLATHDLQQRLARAEVRRLIVLDKRRLLAGRHGNYVRSAAHARWLHTQRVRERRDHTAQFRAQCLRSRSFVRLRSAEIRRALHLAAIRAGADEAAAKRDAARLRVQFATESLRAHLEFRLLRADEKRLLYMADKVAAAIFFAAQGEIVRRRLASREEARRLTYAYGMESAGLRTSIARTQRARSHLLARALVAGRQKYLADARAERGFVAAMRHGNAADRRDDVREAKQETARRTIQRVTFARLERQSTDVVDAAVKTAMAATIALHAERRRVALLQARAVGARAQSRRARDVARVQKIARRIEALALCEQRLDESAKRRAMLLAQRKLGLSASQLQPFAGLVVVGTAIPLPYSA
ncbi:hypothetical protein SDRG_06884 [Saprolegnia diclina VS20]|uniref:Uncharacterized protein n=1 Tax=Saprolegnia diclina (strain VS20) TaxID=1156394 RepID=T0QLK6_SAPDV|nr:hypothetical protein SDRG_06884 [Saprolegnia diclina VS20]EQC35596.1 hypothetical protein SDRG_06884 [Saprolegnia diclina VS20]|eukprot:XP_008610913.1 hypothetical protein SDRG_06884 [Saprolegnia diclina VS20]